MMYCDLCQYTRIVYLFIYHLFYFLDDNQLVCWGWNEHGMCATGDETNVTEPRLVRLLKDRKVTLIGAGAGHCYAITQTDTVT